MPFETTTDLPAPVREGLDGEGQEQFLAVVNERLEAGDSEGEAFRKAWGAVANAELPDAVADVLTAEAVAQWGQTFARVTRRNRDVADEDWVRHHAASIAWTMYGPGDCERHEHQETESGTELDELPEEGRRLERLMDREERGLANDLKQLVIDYRKDFKRFVRDNPNATPGRLDRYLRQLRDTYRPKMRDAIAERTRRIRERTREITLDENPRLAELVSPSRLPNPDVRQNAGFENSLQLIVDDLARELLNRAEGAATGSYSENQRTTDADGEAQQTQIDRPADSTVDKTASEAGSSAVTEGRDDVSKEAQESGAKVMATRTAVLDSNTCDPCESLDGTTVEVGSQRYNRIAPPAKCEGRRRCRCYFEIEVREPADDSTENRAFRGDGVAVEHASFSADEGTWHLLYSWGEKQHPQGDYAVDKEFAAKMKQSFQYMERRHDDHPPIWRNHEDSGFVWGECTALRISSRGIEGRLRFNGLAEPYVEHDAIDRLSPTHIEEFTDPETGEELENVLFEVSFVTREHLKSLPTVSEARKHGVPPTPDSFSRIEQEAQMPDLETDQTENEDTEPTPDVSTDPESGSDGPTEREDGPTRNMPGQKFGDFVLDMIKKVGSVPVGPSQDELLERLTAGTDMSGGDLMERLEAGEMALPPDALVENVSEEFGVPVSDLRAGKFGEADSGGSESGGDDGGSGDDTPDQPEPPQMADDEETENADEPEDLTDAEREEIVAENNALRDEVRRLRTTVVREQCSQRGLDEDATERMLRICHDSGFEAYQHAMEAVDGVAASREPTPEEQSGGGSEEPDEPIGKEHGQTGGTPQPNGDVRKLAQDAAEQELSGRDLVDYFHEHGAQYDEQAKSLVEEYRD